MTLRWLCPCAFCRGEAGQPGWLDSAPTLTEAQTTLTDSQLVGQYAVAPTWADGHHTGFYTFERLREACPCDGGRRARPRPATPAVAPRHRLGPASTDAGALRVAPSWRPASAPASICGRSRPVARGEEGRTDVTATQAPASGAAPRGRVPAAGSCRTSTASCRGSSSTPGSCSRRRTTRNPLLERVALPGDLREQPRRVLPGPRGGSQAAGRGRALVALAATACRRPRCWSGSADRVLQLQALHSEAFAAHPRGARRGGDPDRAATRTGPERQLELRQRFLDQIFPVLTPLAVDPSHPFPYISDLSLSLAVTVRDPDDGRAAVRAHQGAAGAAPPVGGRHPDLRAARAGHRGQPRHAVPGHGDRSTTTCSG